MKMAITQIKVEIAKCSQRRATFSADNTLTTPLLAGQIGRCLPYIHATLGRSRCLQMYTSNRGGELITLLGQHTWRRDRPWSTEEKCLLGPLHLQRVGRRKNIGKFAKGLAKLLPGLLETDGTRQLGAIFAFVSDHEASDGPLIIHRDSCTPGENNRPLAGVEHT